MNEAERNEVSTEHSWAYALIRVEKWKEGRVLHKLG